MSDEELIAQLKNSKGWPTLGKAAADRIEALTAERDRWREIANNEAVEGEANRNAGLALEAKLAKAAEALRSVDDEYSDLRWGPELSSIKQARATLAEIEGSNAP
jgi:archaeosine-15-forming tRNA-guanine transglycosylase